MTFTELVEEVYTLTNRPDLQAETKSAIKAATLKAHTSDYFTKDIYETGISFNESAYQQSLDLYELIPNFRALSYYRRVQDKNDKSGTFFQVLSPEEMLDSYGQQRVDVAYVAGRVLETRAAVNYQYALLGAYVQPIITEANFCSWVAVIQPFAIVYEAAKIVYRAVGNLEESNAMARLAAEEYAILKITGLTDVGS